MKNIKFVVVIMVFLAGMRIEIICGQTCVSCGSAVNSGTGSSAIGLNSSASGAYSLALGSGSQATNLRSIVLGTSSKSTGLSSLALGNLVTASGANSIALGLGASEANLTNNVPNSLMVGFNSNLPTLFVGPAAGITSTGNVGIGTSVPAEKLSVNGVIQSLSGGIKFPDGTIQTTKANSYWTQLGSNLYYSAGSVGVGTNDPKGKLDVFGDIVLGKPGENFILHSRSWIGDALIIAPQNAYGGWEWSNSLTLKDNGQVYIGSDQMAGTSNSDYRLAVNGKIISKEVVVSTQNWADFVFSEDYDLLPINELYQFIVKYRHLPDIPSESQVLERGIGVGEMTTLLLRKVEELTLYLIEQKNQIDELKLKLSETDSVSTETSKNSK